MNCPNCKSRDIKCYRKKPTGSKSEASNEMLCICQNCGYKYKQLNGTKKHNKKASAPNKQKVSEEKTEPISFTGWLLTLIFWPFALTKWFYSSKKIKLEKFVKTVIIVLVWALIIGVFGFVVFGPNSDLPKVIFDRTVTEKREVSTAQFATTVPSTTVPSVSVPPETTGETTTIASIFLQ